MFNKKKQIPLKKQLKNAKRKEKSGYPSKIQIQIQVHLNIHNKVKNKIIDTKFKHLNIDRNRQK